MYIPKKYEEKSWEKSKQIIQENPLATVITTDADGNLMANHFPFYLNENAQTGERFLQAHFAKKNPQAPSLKDNDNVLVIFQSSSSYISPSYYPEKKRTEKFVPTWDFATVHIYGKSKVVDDTTFVRAQLDNFSDQMEKDRQSPWKVSDAHPPYVAALQKAIFGLEISIERIETKFKFEQEMTSENVDGVIHGLAEDGKNEVSHMVCEANGRETLTCPHAKTKAESSCSLA
ncbi:hypothetical protein CLUG_04849 [Clavispora lusitaniae ATCC 42720]|uniref:Transcriptional regulator n=1 Tax=Clavispora lusitaniae (strain ATCC 42720) TaxID=306902 RepID=C4YA01_CLAL4|nr:uncharacterized protein CLUG_04849 [Clavispora lusitaniae ATCC 42720]EEQ40721.1 hypothetical protein CLUG_04849 [Clavispora lusitaniae ATCC 42720]KAF5209372.1 hypothetical protein E0198_004651 [Clavispora lusitaniae]